MDCSIAMVGFSSQHLQDTSERQQMFRITLIDFIFGNTYLHICTLPVAKSGVEKFATSALLLACSVKFGSLIEFIKCKVSSMFIMLFICLRTDTQVVLFNIGC